jgi:hypothetical protein
MDHTLHVFALWIRSTPMHHFMVDVGPAFAACETLHFMGLTVLFASLLLIDLAGLGWIRRVSLIEAHKLVPFAIGAFLVNLITGICFICSNPETYFFNLSFRLKIALILMAGINAFVFEVFVYRPLVRGDQSAGHGALVRGASGLSLLFWSGVLIFGRLIPYVQ